MSEFHYLYNEKKKILDQGVDPSGQRLPIKLDSASNGEFAPIPVAPHVSEANERADIKSAEVAKYLGVSKRYVQTTSVGACSTLLSLNASFEANGLRGGRFEIPDQAAFDEALAKSVVGGDEFIFDIQSHHVNPYGRWRQENPLYWEELLEDLPQYQMTREADPVVGFSAQNFIREIFFNSDTRMCVLSFFPGPEGANPLEIEDALVTQHMLESVYPKNRLFLHGKVQPNYHDYEREMERLAAQYKISAWKSYPQWGPQGRGYWLDDEETGIPFIEKARSLGVKVICVHKGLPFLPDEDIEKRSCRDIGVVAKRYPDMDFIVYHSGYELEEPAEPYKEGGGKKIGIDTLIASLQENEIPKRSNVYAELGSTWRAVMSHPDKAAHLLGKLIKFLGEDRILWGTDSIWYGSPQDQIQAFRTFQISPEFQSRFGYEPISKETKEKIFGLNAVKPYKIPESYYLDREPDLLAKKKEHYFLKSDPAFQTFGPRTDAEYQTYLQWSQS